MFPKGDEYMFFNEINDKRLIETGFKIRSYKNGF